MQHVIQVKNLTKKFSNDFIAVNDLSFSVPKGEVFGFLGQNGAGKSTTMRMLLTLIEPTSGSIDFFGKPLKENRNFVLKNVGALIEKPDVYKYLTAYENIKLFAALSGVKKTKKELLQQLAIVGLESRATDKVKNFSQGMKQRLGIAVALVHNPEVVILDEPTNGLDPQGIADIRNLIIGLSEEHKKTVIVSSHLLNEIEQMATSILIIDKGKKIIEGLKTDLFDPSQTLVSIDTNDNLNAKQILQQTQWQPFLQEGEADLKLQLHKNQIPQLIQFLATQPIEVFAIKPIHSLEDYFLKVTHHVHTI
ncbi:MAG: ABC transporter ATP-binding protein [Chitinophagaceae bacterium]